MPAPALVAAAPAIAGTIAGGIRAIGAGGQLRRDKAELARLSPAFYEVQDEYYGNVNQAAELAHGGFTAASKDFYSDMAGRGLGTSISAVLSAGGTPNDISRIFDSYNTSIRKIGAEDAERQIANIKYFQNTAKDLAGQKTTQWAINEYQPYQNKLKELTQRIAADKQNIWSGITSAIGSAEAGVTSMQNQSLLNDLFKSSEKAAEGAVSGATQGLLGGATSVLGERSGMPEIPDPFMGRGGKGDFDEYTGVNWGDVGRMAVERQTAMDEQQQQDFMNMINDMQPEDFQMMMDIFKRKSK